MLIRCLDHFLFWSVILTSIASSAKSQSPPASMKMLPEIHLSQTEEDIFRLINDYRLEKGLPAIRLSASLTYVAQLHVHDLAENNQAHRFCNLHSWSSNRDWTSCCYTGNHETAACMWNKPRELTNYPGEGYEVAYWTDERLGPLDYALKALRGWEKSPQHNRVLTNDGEWRRLDWKAMGVGYYQGYTAVWFGAEPDDDQTMHLCDN